MGYKDFLALKVDKTQGSRSPEPTAGQPLSPVSPRPYPPNPFQTSADSSVAPTPTAGSRSATPSFYAGNDRTRSMALDLVKNQVMINYLYQQQGNNGWRSGKPGAQEGVILRVSRETYLTHPPQLQDSELAESLRSLNVQSAMTMQSPVIKSYLDSFPTSVDIPLLNGLAVQVVPNIERLAMARTHQFAAVIASEALLVVWDDDAVNMLSRAKTIEWELMQLLWTSNPFDSKMASKIDLTINEKEMDDISNEEAAAPPPRPTLMIHHVYVSIAITVMIGTIGLGFRTLLIEYLYEEGFAPMPYLRFIFVILTPLWMWFSLFFFNVMVNNVGQLIGPIHQLQINSKHYSAVKSPRLTRNLPHVTVQCPVYKESLAEVIVPTVQSIKKAISTYELQGGSANMFWNDDGLQLISEEERDERMAFYADNGIGWVARPAHSKEPNGFKRKGKFKKASNMNFALAVSCAMEEKLLTLPRDESWTSTDEAEATAWALEEVVNEKGGVAWADGNIRIGDYILIIDSDTRVPTDCLLDAVSELEVAPEVAILQSASGVMQVAWNYFENGITFFTNWVYSAIRFGVGNGDCAPFVGHNAFLRWSAIQDVAFEEDGIMKFWSESHVSEDFDISLRLQIKGYITRLMAWDHGGFQEGVSLTVYDELARWQKYAYGCNELVFHPFRFWLVRGPFTPLFRTFLGSNIPFCSKLTMISYMGTYYAISATWLLILGNYFIVGWFKGDIDRYYLSSWAVFLSLLVVFSGLGNVALATMRYRLGERSFIGSLLENFKWLFMLSIFLGGISIHVSQAILAHMFEIDMSWGATAKTLEFTNFFVEVPKTLRKFWFSFSFCIVVATGMVIMATANFIPYSYHIVQIEPVIPMANMLICHFLLPLALNPGLMTFAF